MKKKTNKLTWLLLMLLISSGCARHKNIVQNATMTRALLKDTKTGQERIYECPNNDEMKSILIWLGNGDAVDIISHDYDNTLILTPENCRLVYDKAQIERYRQEMELAKKRYEMQLELAK